MNMKFVKSLVLVCAMMTSSVFGQIAVTNSMTADQAVQYLLGPGVTYFNAQFTGSAIQLGQLTGLGTPSNFQIAEGVVICTDDVLTLDPNGLVGTISPDIATQPDLLSVAQSVPPMIGQTFTITSVHNVAMLEFDFVATGNTLNFNYIFGSDEYLTFVNTQYNDVFSFFLSGPGITGPYSSPAGFPGGSVNIAAVPNSNPPLPITISSVNNVLNNSYYVDNAALTDISSNGYTTSLTAEHPLQCGSTYHIRLAIADCGDQSLQSFVCLQAGSFNVGTNLITPLSVSAPGISPIPNFPSNAILEGESCYDGSFIINPPACSIDPDTIQIVYGGTATYGTDYTTGNVQQLILYPNTPDTLFINALVDHQAETDSTITYSGITSGVETITVSFIYSHLIDGVMTVDTATSTLLLVDYNPVELGNINNVAMCYGVPQSVNVSSLVSNGVPNYTYTWEDPTGQVVGTGATETLNHSQANPITPGEYWVTVRDYCGITDSSKFNIITPTPPPNYPNALDSLICMGDPDTLWLPENNAFSYEWYYYDVDLAAEVDMASNTNFLVIPSVWAETFHCVITEETCNYDDTASFSYLPQICEILIPNIITPNETYDAALDLNNGNPKGNNNLWIQGLVDNKGVRRFPGSTLKVYNRWGNLVYENDNYDNSWNPTDLNSGTYYYVFMLNRKAKEEFYNGNLEIVK
jgi:hypothetical protein